MAGMGWRLTSNISTFQALDAMQCHGITSCIDASGGSGTGSTPENEGSGDSESEAVVRGGSGIWWGRCSTFHQHAEAAICGSTERCIGQSCLRPKKKAEKASASCHGNGFGYTSEVLLLQWMTEGMFRIL